MSERTKSFSAGVYWYSAASCGVGAGPGRPVRIRSIDSAWGAASQRACSSVSAHTTLTPIMA